MGDPSTDLLKSLRHGETVFGSFLSLGSSLAAEACALAGFDWLLADLEHGGGDEVALLGQLLAAERHQTPTVVRVESGERIRVGRALDLGAAGIMFPRLDTPEQVAEAIRHLRYPPTGDRGVASYNRSRGFGLATDSLEDANNQIVGIVQIETLQALKNVNAIALVRGVDVLFVGPGDLSHALGIPGELASPLFVDAMTRVVSACRSAGISAGILASSAASARGFSDLGFTFIGIGSDVTHLANSARVALAEARAQA